MPFQPARRNPLKGSRRIPLTVTVDPDTYDKLSAYGNRSHAIEELVKRYLDALIQAEKQAPAPNG